MAALLHLSEGDQKCSSCDRKADAKFICQNCDISRRYLCIPCQVDHLESNPTGDHKVIDLEEYLKGADKYPLAKDFSCAIHQEAAFENACQNCKQFVCMPCEKEFGKSVCPSPAARDGRHEVEALVQRSQSLKRDLNVGEKSAERQAVEAIQLLSEMGNSRKRVGSLLRQTSDCIEGKLQELLAELKQKMEPFSRKAEALAQHELKEISKREEKLRAFLEDNAQARLMAVATAASSNIAQVHWTAPDVIGKLKGNSASDLPSPPSSDKHAAQAEALQEVIASLQVSLSSMPDREGGSCLTLSPSLPDDLRLTDRGHSFEVLPPLDGGVVPEASYAATALAEGQGILEAFWYDKGLFLYDKIKGVRVTVTPEGSYNGLLVSASGSNAYCTRIDEWSEEAFVEKYRFTKGGSLELQVKKAGFQWPMGIAESPQTMRIACVDQGMVSLSVNGQRSSRITLHSSGDFRQIRSLERVEGGVQILWQPGWAAWHPDEHCLYVTDSGDNEVSPSIMCLELGHPAKVVWRSAIGKTPWNMAYIQGLLYVAHGSLPRVTVLSAEHGRVVDMINCPGYPRGVWEGEPGHAVIVCYPTEKAPTVAVHSDTLQN